ncbi:purine-binding protein precursor [Clostridium tepidiprofundi DSM 19306]|uniref:Purine-binding protein n=1 Tax=Clostridium tepidiprofundi DSM 19306 TaxID=1121338 RepID=A0A151B301_9CLOT|nr:BMP family ABC transporter substrate-binding protein [Clostridium tepidiprofundi]KYH34037.1 purine-binding protein precursor [Clostridium tepidiprofundi DSM 19306]
MHDMLGKVGDEYEKANKLAKIKFHEDKVNGLSGNIPSLDKILNDIDIVAVIPLGIKTVPLKKIVGTYFYTRGRDFASNFLPLADVNSEFAVKWEAVYKHQLNDGIHDPVKVYEYMNYFYVMEGNKRVSVLKYFNAYEIECDITRLVPKKDESDINNKIYYQFLEFNNKTGIDSIWLSHENDFIELEKYLDEYEPILDEYADKYTHFMKNVYLPFRSTFYELGGYKLNMTTGDAFLNYARIYGIPNKFRIPERTVRLKKLLSELEMISKGNNADIQTKPFAVQKKNVITSIASLVSPHKKLKVAFALEKTIQTSGWSYVHNKGRLAAEKALEGHIETFAIENVPPSGIKAYKKMRKIAQEGYDIIFTTCPTLLNVSLRAALKYENIKFFNCSPVKAYRNVSTYFARTHEPRFLLGLIAGSLTKSNVIGYIDIYMPTEIVTGINAFALGVKTVNPHAVVNVSWLNEIGDIEHSRTLIKSLYESGADLIMQNDLTAFGNHARDYGLYSIKYDKENDIVLPNINYASIIWNWGNFYTKVLQNISNGNWKGIFSTRTKRVSFWWGMDSGMIDIKYLKENVPIQTQKLVDFMRQMIIENRFHAFVGPVYDQEGNCRIHEGDIANYEDMLYMDWFVDNINGKIRDI